MCTYSVQHVTTNQPNLFILPFSFLFFILFFLFLSMLKLVHVKYIRIGFTALSHCLQTPSCNVTSIFPGKVPALLLKGMCNYIIIVRRKWQRHVSAADLDGS